MQEFGIVLSPGRIGAIAQGGHIIEGEVRDVRMVVEIEAGTQVEVGVALLVELAGVTIIGKFGIASNGETIGLAHLLAFGLAGGVGKGLRKKARKAKTCHRLDQSAHPFDLLEWTAKACRGQGQTDRSYFYLTKRHAMMPRRGGNRQHKRPVHKGGIPP